MVSQIELSCEPDGRWIAEVHALPGLQLYGYSQDETLEAARKLSAMLLYKERRGDHSILAFYPGRIPDTTTSQKIVAALSEKTGRFEKTMRRIFDPDAVQGKHTRRKEHTGQEKASHSPHLSVEVVPCA